MLKRGNPRWGQVGYNPVRAPHLLTQFETLASTVGAVTLEEQRQSIRLQEFARKHRRSRYVPEELLKTWGLEVRDDELMGRSLEI